jgi:hypothetical protein
MAGLIQGSLDHVFHKLFQENYLREVGREAPDLPGQGHRMEDLTPGLALLFLLYFYVIVYQPEVYPICIMAVLRGRTQRETNSETAWRRGHRPKRSKPNEDGT